MENESSCEFVQLLYTAMYFNGHKVFNKGTHLGFDSIEKSIKKGIMTNRVTPEKIRHPKENEVWVFPSNLAGRHGKGLAKEMIKYGAVYGQGVGHFGQTYALPTKDVKIQTVGIKQINFYVRVFLEYAKIFPKNVFLVTKIGCGLAGYTPKEIAPLFKEAVHINNIHLPESFWEVLNKN